LPGWLKKLKVYAKDKVKGKKKNKYLQPGINSGMQTRALLLNLNILCGQNWFLKSFIKAKFKECYL